MLPRIVRYVCGITLLLFVSGMLMAARNSPRVVHVLVALADNQHQGIVPVPAKLGNGDDPGRNIYWGSAYGVKIFFARSADWQLVSKQKGPRPAVLERCIFKHRTHDVYVIADAYPGAPRSGKRRSSFLTPQPAWLLRRSSIELRRSRRC